MLSFASECVEGAHAHEESTAGDLDDGDDQGVGEGPQQGATFYSSIKTD